MYSNKINLLQLVKNLEVGGIEKSTILYSNLLCDKLNFVGIMASMGFYDNYYFIYEKTKRFYPLFQFTGKIHFLKNLFYLLNVIKKNQITHIHYHHRIFLPFVYLIKLKNPNIKIIYTHHSCFNDYINNFIYADKIIAINGATKNDLPKRFQNKTIIIPHGIRINEKHIDVKKDSIQNIGYVGRFVESKNLIYLINEFKIVNNDIPNTQLILVGDGPIKDDLITLVDKLGLIKNVIFKNPLNSEDDIYNNIDILVLPSTKLEGFGIVLLEAMSRGIPVVVNRLESFKDLVIDKFNGLVFESNLADKLLTLFYDRTLFKKLSKNGIFSVNGKYNIERIIKEYSVKIYF